MIVFFHFNLYFAIIVIHSNACHWFNVSYTFDAAWECAFLDLAQATARFFDLALTHTHTHSHRFTHCWQLSCRSQQFHLWQLYVCVCVLHSINFDLHPLFHSCDAQLGCDEWNLRNEFLRNFLSFAANDKLVRVFLASDVAMLLLCVVRWNLQRTRHEEHLYEKGSSLVCCRAIRWLKKMAEKTKIYIFSARMKVFQDVAINGSNSTSTSAGTYCRTLYFLYAQLIYCLLHKRDVAHMDSERSHVRRKCFSF